MTAVPLRHKWRAGGVGSESLEFRFRLDCCPNGAKFPDVRIIVGQRPMDLQLPAILSEYVRASNAHDVEAILACFSEAATVRDENETLHGKEAIRGWITKTITRYSFRFEPIGAHQDEDETILSMTVSGTFPGSPVTLDFQFGRRPEKSPRFQSADCLN